MTAVDGWASVGLLTVKSFLIGDLGNITVGEEACDEACDDTGEGACDEANEEFGELCGEKMVAADDDSSPDSDIENNNTVLITIIINKY